MSKIQNEFYAASGIKIKNYKIADVKNYKASSSTMYQVASCSKFITGIVVAKLYEEGLINYDADVNTYLVNWKVPNNKIVTLRQLLSHRSGSTDGNGYYGCDIDHHNLSLSNNVKILNGETYAKPPNFTMEPGTRYQYSGAGFQIVQQVLEDITGMLLYQLMDKYIFEPLKMKNSTGGLIKLTSRKKNKIANTAGHYRLFAETAAAGVWMSTGDLAILLLDLMAAFKNDAGKILRQATIKMITTGQNANINLGDLGLGMFIEQEAKTLLFYHSGLNYGYVMNFWCRPEIGEAQIIMANYIPGTLTDNNIQRAKRLVYAA